MPAGFGAGGVARIGGQYLRHRRNNGIGCRNQGGIFLQGSRAGERTSAGFGAHADIAHHAGDVQCFYQY